MDVLSQIKLYHLTLWFIVVLTVLAVLYKFIQYLKLWKHLCMIPGPKGYPFIGNIHLALLTPSKLFYTLKKYARIYYPIFKLSLVGNTLVVLVSPDDVEMVTSQMKHIEKGINYTPLQGWLKEGLLLSDGAKWQHRRKLLTPTFHFTILNQFTKIFTEESNKLVGEIEKISNQPVDVLSTITKFTLQSICETAMGSKLEENQGGEQYKEAIYETGALVVETIIKPWLQNIVLQKFTWRYWKSKLRLRYLHKFTTNVIKQREQSFKLSDVELKENNLNSRKRMAMLDLLLSAKLKTNNIDDEGIQEEVDTFMFEGHDTTAASITFSLMALANHSDIQEKVYEELKYILNNSTRDFTMEDLNEMKYLERVIKESLRFYPSVPVIGRALSEDVITPSGYFIPKGVTVLIDIFNMHHDPNYYENPEMFDPDRFLPENTKGKHPYAYIPFSAGPRNCIGQKFAMLEMKAAIATILRKFVLYPVDTPETIELQTDLILRSTKPILVEFQNRGDASY